MAEVVIAPYHLTRYPWDKWLDGQAWELKRGVDFEVSVQSMRCNVAAAAKKRGYKVVIKVTSNMVKERESVYVRRILPLFPKSRR